MPLLNTVKVRIKNVPRQSAPTVGESVGAQCAYCTLFVQELLRVFEGSSDLIDVWVVSRFRYDRSASTGSHLERG